MADRLPGQPRVPVFWDRYPKLRDPVEPTEPFENSSFAKTSTPTDTDAWRKLADRKRIVYAKEMYNTSPDRNGFRLDTGSPVRKTRFIENFNSPPAPGPLDLAARTLAANIEADDAVRQRNAWIKTLPKEEAARHIPTHAGQRLPLTTTLPTNAPVIRRHSPKIRQLQDETMVFPIDIDEDFCGTGIRGAERNGSGQMETMSESWVNWLGSELTPSTGHRLHLLASYETDFTQRKAPAPSAVAPIPIPQKGTTIMARTIPPLDKNVYKDY